MNKSITVLLLGFIALTGCKKEEIIEPTPEPTIKAEIPFLGTWQRQFEAGPGNLHTVDYLIYQDSIRYTLTGPVGQANYVMQRDTFLLENNRFIGHTSSNQYYLIFVKDENSDSLTLYKQEVADVADGMSIDLPSYTTTANHGWSTYHKQ